LGEDPEGVVVEGVEASLQHVIPVPKALDRPPFQPAASLRGRAQDRVKPVRTLFRNKRGEARGLPVARQVRASIQDVVVPTVLDVGAKLRMKHRPLSLQVLCDPSEEALDLLSSHVAEVADLVLERGQERVCRRLEALRVRRGYRGAGLFERPADAGPKPVLAPHLPLEPTAHVIDEGGIIGNPAPILEGFVLSKPLHVRGDERGDEPFLPHCAQVVLGYGVLEGMQRHRALRLLHELLNGAPQVEPVRTRPEEARSVGRVLHRIGKRKQALVFVVGRGEKLGDEDAREARGPRPNDGKPPSRAAERTVVAPNLLPFFGRLAVVGAEDRHEPVLPPAGLAGVRLRIAEVQVVAAKLVATAFRRDVFGWPDGKGERKGRLVVEVAPVDAFQVVAELALVLPMDADPAHRPALQTVREGKMGVPI
jgi:hypothetical protein